jgi:uncharacterized circularly permuted ATP-grasp superfamily protein
MKILPSNAFLTRTPYLQFSRCASLSTTRFLDRLITFPVRLNCSTQMATMARDKILRVRLSDEEWERLEAYAKSKDYTLTEVIRDYIKRLPRVN